MLDTSRAKRWVALREQKLRLEAELKRVKSDMSDLEADVLEDLADEGIQRFTIDGTTLYQRRLLKANRHPDAEMQDLVAALDTVGQGHLASQTVNANTLSAWVRELEDAGEELPDEVDDLIVVHEIFQLGARAGG